MRSTAGRDSAPLAASTLRRPHQPPETSSIADQVARNQRYNFVILTLDGLFFWLGISYFSPTTILPLFVSHLTQSNVVVGAVPAVVYLCWAIPQLLGARVVAGQRSRKRYIVRTALMGRIPLLVLLVVTALYAASHPTLTLVVFFVCFGLFRLSSGLNNPAYYDLVATVIHPRARARFIGLSQFLGGAIGAAGLAAGRKVLDEFPFPGGFLICFIAGSILITVAICFMAAVREPIVDGGIDVGDGASGEAGGGLAGIPTDTAPQRRPPVWAVAERAVRDDAALRRYLTVRIFLALGSMAAAFYAVHATRGLGASDGDVAFFTSVVLASQTVSTLVWGELAGRIRLWPVLLAGCVLTALGAMLALAIASLTWFVLVFLIVGVAAGALAVTDAGMPLSLAERSPAAGTNRPAYVALCNTLLAPFQMAAPLIGGLAADAAGYSLTYALALAVSLGACLLAVLGLRATSSDHAR